MPFEFTAAVGAHGASRACTHKRDVARPLYRSRTYSATFISDNSSRMRGVNVMCEAYASAEFTAHTQKTPPDNGIHRRRAHAAKYDRARINDAFN